MPKEILLNVIILSFFNLFVNILDKVKMKVDQ